VNKDELHVKDSNGWQPLHEAVRGGYIDVAKFLVSNGGNVNERTDHGTGGTPLWWAIETHGVRHEMVRFLKTLGAIKIGPEL